MVGSVLPSGTQLFFVWSGLYDLVIASITRLFFIVHLLAQSPILKVGEMTSSCPGNSSTSICMQVRAFGFLPLAVSLVSVLALPFPFTFHWSLGGKLIKMYPGTPCCSWVTGSHNLPTVLACLYSRTEAYFTRRHSHHLLFVSRSSARSSKMVFELTLLGDVGHKVFALLQ